MTELPTDLIVQRCHDRKWQYPEPLDDLDSWVSDNWDAFDPRHRHHMYWPDRAYQSGMEILVVDGGTTQAPVLARTNPEARVTATVVSKDSHDRAIYLRHKYRLNNLELHRIATADIAALNRDFDLVIASGVLQQADYAEADRGMKAIAHVLRPEGVAALLLYSRYLPTRPAAGHRPDADESPLHDSTVNFGVQQCLDLVEGSGLVFQDWLEKSSYYLPTAATRGVELFSGIAGLPDREMWSVVEPLRNLNGCHLFTACRPDRPIEKYRIDFAETRALDFLVGWRIHAGVEGNAAVRRGWTLALEPVHRELASRIDGFSTIRQIAGRPDLEPVALELVKELWHMDFVVVAIS